jgi:hypothetical protein
MEGSAEPWSAADLAAGRLIGATLADVVLQVRSVQMLILQDQLDKVRRQVHVSEQPLIIADAAGRVLLANEAFEQLLPATHAPLERLDDLAMLFSERVEVSRRLADLVRYGQTWRSEVHLETDSRGAQPVLVRGDPVYASPGRVRGFVLLLTDNTERTTAAAARRRFQEGLIERHHLGSGPIGSRTELIYRNLMSKLVENAQLAALEITDRADVEKMPEMLESVRSSVGRTAEVLEHLILYARRRGNPQDDEPI